MPPIPDDLPVATALAAQAHIAVPGFEPELETELGDAIIARHGPLYLSRPLAVLPAWAEVSWLDVFEASVPSIGKAAALLRSIQRNWANLPLAAHGRAKLIGEKLPHISAKPLVFPQPARTAPIGGWALLDDGRMLFSAQTSSVFPGGHVGFEEDRQGPPSRAYLKLWEGLTRLGRMPQPGERCLDLGACPGGWTWVAASLGAAVTAIDKAPLDPAVRAMPGVTERLVSAFSLDPETEEAVDWLFSDIICYPPRLLALVQRWMAAGKARNILCTLKFQGATDHAAAAGFAAIPGGRLLHLHHNKHELTWMWPAQNVL